MTGISSDRRASSAACSESARRTGGPWLAIRSIPGTQPTVETVVWAFEIPASGSRSQAPRTASRFIIGSPIPMKTAWLTAPRRRKWRAWSTISDSVRLRPKLIRPVAQKVQVSGHPDWLERQTERRPSR